MCVAALAQAPSGLLLAACAGKLWVGRPWSHVLIEIWRACMHSMAPRSVVGARGRCHAHAPQARCRKHPPNRAYMEMYHHV